MKVTAIPIDEVLALETISVTDFQRRNIFDTDSTAKCLLDCSIAKARSGIASQRATNPGDKRKKQQEFATFRKNRIQIQRQALQPDKRVLKGALKGRRDPFSLTDLEASSENGCESCRFLFYLLDGLFAIRSDLDRHVAELQWVGYGFLLQVQVKGTGQTFMFQFLNPTGARTTIQDMHTANLLNGDTCSTLSFERACSWIKDCVTSHQHCGEGRDVPLPKRVLDLEVVVDSKGDDGVRLLDTEDKQGTYACLSHCWGKIPMPIRTTMATLNDHYRFIPYSSLPKTFRDAIAITRRLGVRYLWIDSLCIIQDSPLDWQIESSKMADIYQNSYITVAAVSSSNFRGGCFSSDKTGDMCLELVDDGQKTILAVRECKGTSQLRTQEDIANAFPLFSRAWVYQERILSRRVLYCNQNELQLECREVLVCECNNHHIAPHPHPGTHGVRGLGGDFKKKYAEALKKYGVRGQYSPHELFQHWQRTVSQYSRLQLTHNTDILPALSGCARDIGRLTGDTYLAGLWRASLAEGMLWAVNGSVQHPRPAVWRAPTWSWASVDVTAGIDYTFVLQSRFRQHFQDKIESAACSLVGADTTGQVSAGYLRVRSGLCPAYLRRLCRNCARTSHRRKYTIEHGRQYAETWYAGQNSKNIDVAPCRFKVKGLELGDAHVVSVFPDFKYDDRVDFAFFDAEDGKACKLAPVSLLHVYDTQSAWSPVVTDYFLILRPAQTALGSKTFERTALASIGFPSWEQRNTWFESVYDKLLTEKTIVEIV